MSELEKKMLKGVVSMPSNIFATTGTNVSVLFLDRENKEEVVHYIVHIRLKAVNHRIEINP